MAKKKGVQSADAVVDNIDAQESDLDWVSAKAHLKQAIAEAGDDSIDNYLKKAPIMQLRGRYNGGERTEELFNAIMALPVDGEDNETTEE